MKYYILTKNFTGISGSVYWARKRPYMETEVPAEAIAKGYTVEVDGPDSTLDLVVVDSNEIDNRKYNKQSNDKTFRATIKQIDPASRPVITPKYTPQLTYKQEPDVRYNINTATESELNSIKGVGKATIAKIIELRPFESMEDLGQKVKLPFKTAWSDLPISVSAEQNYAEPLGEPQQPEPATADV